MGNNLKPYFKDDITAALKTAYRALSFSNAEEAFIQGFTAAIFLLCSLFNIDISNITEKINVRR